LKHSTRCSVPSFDLRRTACLEFFAASPTHGCPWAENRCASLTIFLDSTFGGANRKRFVLEAHPEIDSGRRIWHRWEDILLSIMPALACRLSQKFIKTNLLLISPASHPLDPTYSEEKVSSSPRAAFAPWSYIRSFGRKTDLLRWEPVSRWPTNTRSFQS